MSNQNPNMSAKDAVYYIRDNAGSLSRDQILKLYSATQAARKGMSQKEVQDYADKNAIINDGNFHPIILIKNNPLKTITVTVAIISSIPLILFLIFIYIKITKWTWKKIWTTIKE
jgi:hypothetical protein